MIDFISNHFRVRYDDYLTNILYVCYHEEIDLRDFSYYIYNTDGSSTRQ